jgi:hypothetical protein
MPDQRGYLLPEERRILLRRYAPVLTLFPERRAQAPYPDEGDAIYTVRGSYHPRSTAFFLKHGKLRYGGRELLRDPFRLVLWMKNWPPPSSRSRPMTLRKRYDPEFQSRSATPG